MSSYFTDKFLREQPGATMVDYPFPLRPGVTARLRLPIDLRADEVERIRQMLLTLVDVPAAENGDAR